MALGSIWSLISSAGPGTSRFTSVSAGATAGASPATSVSSWGRHHLQGGVRFYQGVLVALQLHPVCTAGSLFFTFTSVIKSTQRRRTRRTCKLSTEKPQKTRRIRTTTSVLWGRTIKYNLKIFQYDLSFILLTNVFIYFATKKGG